MARHTNTHPFDEGKELHKMQSPIPSLSMPSLQSQSGAREYLTSSPPFPGPIEGTHSFLPSWNSNPSSRTQHPYHVSRTPQPHQALFTARQPHVVGPQPGFAQLLNSLQEPVDQQSRRVFQSRPDISDDLPQVDKLSASPRARSNESESPCKEDVMNTSHVPEARFLPQARPEYQPRSIPISGLLTGDPSPAYRPIPRYKISLRQQPIAARACGFGDRDRRVIDPPPILQLSIDDETATPEQIKAQIQKLSYSVVLCTILDPGTHEEDVMMPGVIDKRQQRRLMGTLVASPFVGLDEFDVEGCFYTFPDLSVRTPGTYRLHFRLVVLDPGRMGPGYTAPVSTSVTSKPFQVYNAKEFGGMRPSSELTKRLKHQGCLISVKKGNVRNTTLEPEDEDDDGDDNEDSMSAVKKGKRPKQ